MIHNFPSVIFVVLWLFWGICVVACPYEPPEGDEW